MSTTTDHPAGVTRERVRLDGGEVAMMRAGSGAPVLVLHGAGAAGVWMPWHAKLAEHYDVLAPDHPGFGGSDDFAELDDVQDLAFHYADLITALGLERVAVVGSSFGGWISAELAAYRPALVERLVLINAIGHYIDGHPIGDLFGMTPAQKMAALFADPAGAAGLLPPDPDIDTIVDMARSDASFARFAWAPFCHDPRLPRLLPRVAAPTLVLWGERDALVPIAHGERYAELIPGAELVVLPRAGHVPTIDAPDDVVACVQGFLSS